MLLISEPLTPLLDKATCTIANFVSSCEVIAYFNYTKRRGVTLATFRATLRKELAERNNKYFSVDGNRKRKNVRKKGSRDTVILLPSKSGRVQ